MSLQNIFQYISLQKFTLLVLISVCLTGPMTDTTDQVSYTEPPEGAGARMGAKYQWSPDPALAAIIGVVTVIIVLIPIVCSVCFHLQLRTDSQRKKVAWRRNVLMFVK